MPSDLFDPMLHLALRVAKRGQKKKPPIAPPAKVLPLTKLTKLPPKAKEAIFEALDADDEFRDRVAEAATEAKVGRTAMMFLERPDGWQKFVDTMVEAAEEPIIEPASDSEAGANAEELASLNSALTKERADHERTAEAASALKTEIEGLEAQLDTLNADLDSLREENADLVEQRKQAVRELKHAEEVMTRHIAERKRVEALLESMTAAQLTTSSVGGEVTGADVRHAVDAMGETVDALRSQLDELHSAATPETVPTVRRKPLPVPPGLFDDSVDYAEYLLNIPGMTVLIDGYNLTKEAQPNQQLDVQRSWLLQGLAAITGRFGATFEVVFDGAGVAAPNNRAHERVRHRFTPEGVEADDDIIAAVGSIDAGKPVTVVSSDRRVRDGAAGGGANVIYSRQLATLLG